MSIQHLYFQELKSTQDYLHENWGELSKSGRSVLVEASQQTHGRGRLERSWYTAEGSLAISFSLSSNPQQSLTSIEVSCLIALFLEQEHKQQVSLKWPNDLLIEHKKCGGVLLQSLESNIYACGVGLNIRSERDKELKKISNIGSFDFSALSLNLKDKDIGAKLYRFILHNRLSEHETLVEFKKRCAHIGKRCTIQTHQEKISGTFTGIGPHGEALLKTNEEKISFYNGTLRYDI